ncbi:hypothetical protein TNIN_155251 [Trichonephila inaurata madagascariensis]|uniref:Uncharacterized protein n=1 Tax=Trichonephila inaurata madagascariensis TaxID=2747483 RepID=A0A8X7CID9_9ARAC|nr:hypothetical protein TNIN_155251 [Trichonephila inaurata madagascariensis]
MVYMHETSQELDCEDGQTIRSIHWDKKIYLAKRGLHINSIAQIVPSRREVVFPELFGTGNSVFLLAAAFASLFAVHESASSLVLL